MPAHGIWFVAGGCVTALVILTVVLFFLPSVAPPPAVTIESIHWQVEQNAPVNGTPEFSELWINQSGPQSGFPYNVRAGGTFNDSLVLVNDEPYSVYICNATLEPPLLVVAHFPSFPMTARAMEDNLLTLTIAVQAGAGSVVTVNGIVNAANCGEPS
jgi:hypothetical protein